MELERLSLRVAAAKAGLEVVDPPIAKGRSGVSHRFSFLATDGFHSFAFDFYDEVGEIEVLRTYVKSIDTGALTNVVCLSGIITEKAERAAEEYRMKVLGPSGLAKFFER